MTTAHIKDLFSQIRGQVIAIAFVVFTSVVGTVISLVVQVERIKSQQEHDTARIDKLEKYDEAWGKMEVELEHRLTRIESKLDAVLEQR